MAVQINPPPLLRIPDEFFNDPILSRFFEDIRTILFQLWKRTGGDEDIVGGDSSLGIINSQLVAQLQALNSKLHSRANSLDVRTDDNASVIAQNILDITNNLQAIAGLNAFTSKIHSRVNGFQSSIDSNTGTTSNNQQLISGIDALLQKTRSSQNNTNKILLEQIELRETAATGVIDGGTVNAITATTVDVLAGNGEIVDGYTDRREPSRINVKWPDTFGITIAMPDNIGVAVITVDSNNVVGQQPSGLTATERRTKVQLAFVYYKDGVIDPPIQAGILSNEVGNTLYDWIYFTPASDRVNGLGIDDVAGNLEIWGNSGELMSPGSGKNVLITNPNIFTLTAIGSPTLAAPFDVLFADGTTHLSAQTTIPKLYESAPGVASGLTGQRAVIHYIYRNLGNKLYLQLGNFEYANGADARDSLENDRGNFINFTGAQTTLLSAQVYVDNGASDFSDNISAGIVSLIGDGAGASGVVPVNTLLGLSDVLETTYIGNERKVLSVDSTGIGAEFSDTIFSETTGASLRGPVATATPPTTEAVTARLEIFDSTGVNRLCRLGFGNDNRLLIRNDMRGGIIVIDALNAAGVRVNLITGNPDGPTNIYDNGVLVANTATAALGGLFTTNNLTGSGNERVQTDSDFTKVMQQAVAW